MKRGLCTFADKRLLLAYSIHTQAYGHHAVPSSVEHDAPSDGEDGAKQVLSR